MSFVTFARKEEYEKYLKFINNLTAKRKVLYLSTAKRFNYVPSNRTGVYIHSTPEQITVFFERGKVKSVKVA